MLELTAAHMANLYISYKMGVPAMTPAMITTSECSICYTDGKWRLYRKRLDYRKIQSEEWCEYCYSPDKQFVYAYAAENKLKIIFDQPTEARRSADKMPSFMVTYADLFLSHYKQALNSTDDTYTFVKGTCYALKYPTWSEAADVAQRFGGAVKAIHE